MLTILVNTQQMQLSVFILATLCYHFGYFRLIFSTFECCHLFFRKGEKFLFVLIQVSVRHLTATSSTGGHCVWLEWRIRRRKEEQSGSAFILFCLFPKLFSLSLFSVCFANLPCLTTISIKIRKRRLNQQKNTILSVGLIDQPSVVINTKNWWFTMMVCVFLVMKYTSTFKMWYLDIEFVFSIQNLYPKLFAWANTTKSSLTNADKFGLCWITIHDDRIHHHYHQDWYEENKLSRTGEDCIWNWKGFE